MGILNRYSIAAFALSTVMACACSVNPSLREAERLLEDYPDSALSVLEGIDREKLSDSENVTYDFLSARAFYGTYYFLDDNHSSALSRAYIYKERQRYHLSLLIMLVSAILATLVLYFLAKRAQSQKLLLQERQKNEMLLSSAEDLRTKLNVSKRDAKKPVPDGVRALERLCEQFYIYEGTDNLQPKILKEVKDIVEGLRSDPGVLRSLEEGLNSSHDGIVSSLRKDFPQWKEEDFRLFIFAASGFSSTTLSTLLERDKPYVYNHLYRLKERIKNSDKPRREAYLSVL